MWTRMAKHCKVISDETITGVLKLEEMVVGGVLVFPRLNVNDCVTKSNFGDVHGCRGLLLDKALLEAR